MSYLALDNLSVGFDDTFNLRTKQLEKYNFGVNWVPATGAQVGVRHESNKFDKAKPELHFGKFFLLFSHAASATQTVGTEFVLDW